MRIRPLEAVLLAGFCLLASARLAVGADPDNAVVLRVFLTDGTTLASYGEIARVDDRVIFSMPTGTGPNPPLQLVNLSAGRIDWDRTNRYAESARATRYVETQADADFAVLSNQVAQALSDVTANTDPAKRLAIAEGARKMLADWPQSHYNFRLAEVRQMVSILDESIADLRAAAGGQQFSLSLIALAAPPAITDPLLPAPTIKESIEQVLAASRVVDTASERVTLLSTVLVSLDRDEAALPPEWVAVTRADAKTAIEAERRIDHVYQTLTTRIMALTARRSRVADVQGLERLITTIHHSDTALGVQRPDSINALVAAVQERLDAARRFQLAWDRWTLRAPVIREYQVAIRPQLDLLAGLKAPLESIKTLSGTPPATLGMMQRTVDSIIKSVSDIVPPDELRAAHALFVSAVQLTASAERIRREAVLAGDVTRAWDASSAAAGALMLTARARSDIQTLIRPPQLR